MEFGEVRLENIGPIRQAAIGSHRLSVFVGPNNSGKSIVSRIIHSARRIDPSAGTQACPEDSAAAGQGTGGRDAATACADAVLAGAGMDRSDILTRSMSSGRIELAGRNGKSGLVLDFGQDALPGKSLLPRPPAASVQSGAGERSIYVPSGRTGTI